MDIKTIKPNLSQEANNALSPRSGFSDLPSLLSQFDIRTMKDDLAKAAPRPEGVAAKSYVASPPSSSAATPAPTPTFKTSPAAPPLKSLPEKNKEQELTSQKRTADLAAEEARRLAAEKLKKEEKARSEELSRVFEQTKFKIAAKEYQPAIADAQKILASPAAGWLDKWKAKRLISQARTAIEKEAKKPARPITPAAPKPTVAPPSKTAPPPASGERPTAAAPGNLPVTDEQLLFKPRPVPPAVPTPPITPPSPSERKPVPPAPSLPEPSPPPVPDWPRAERTEPSKTPAKVTFQNLMPGLPATPTKEPAEELDVKKIAAVAIVSIIVLALIVWGFWFFLKQTPATPQISQSPSPQPSNLVTPTPTPAPTPLFEVNSQKIFELKTGQEKANFQEAITTLTRTNEPAGNFVHLLFKNNQNQWLSLTTIVNLAEIDLFDVPNQTSAGPLKNQLLMDDFSFFVYSQNSVPAENFSPFTAVATSTNVGRLGLIIKINNATSTAVSELTKSLKDVEQLMPQSLKILLPEASNLPAQPRWSDNAYKNTAIRYVNFPEPTLSLDYAILNDKLIFTTSKDSMYATIDQLLLLSNQKNPSPSP